jgi:hypothetical protein
MSVRTGIALAVWLMAVCAGLGFLVRAAVLHDLENKARYEAELRAVKKTERCVLERQYPCKRTVCTGPSVLPQTAWGNAHLGPSLTCDSWATIDAVCTECVRTEEAK